MTFERSALGQKNRAIFYDVDWIIYTEGGALDQESVRSFDALFWTGVFRTLGGDFKFRAIPRGGKDQLKPLAQQVFDGSVEKVIVAMDRDYDELFGRLIDRPRIVYTRGYSFENDLYDVDSLLDIFDISCPEIIDRIAEETIIKDWSKNFIASVRWPLKLDVHAVYNSVKGFDREKPQKYFHSSAYGAVPEVARDRMRAEVHRILAEVKSGKKPPVGLTGLKLYEVIGHFWEVFAYKAITSLRHKYKSAQKMAYDHIRSIAMSCFQVRLLSKFPKDMLSHYYHKVVRLALA